MSELWLPIPGFVGRYEASSEGRIRSLTRKVKQIGRWGSEITRTQVGRVMSASPDRDGYLRVQLRPEGVHMVHRLIAAAFHPNPDSKPEVNHKDGVTGNSKPGNLEWCTRSENHLHAFEVLGRKPNVGPSKRVRLTRDATAVEFASVRQAAEHLGVGKTAVMNAVRSGGRCKKHEVAYV